MFFLARLFRARAIRHHFLARFKKFLCNHWLMLSVVKFTVVFEYAVIKRIGKYALDIGDGKHISFGTAVSGESYEIPQFFERIISGGVKSKKFWAEANCP